MFAEGGLPSSIVNFFNLSPDIAFEAIIEKEYASNCYLNSSG
jgi:hypothetical protein